MPAPASTCSRCGAPLEGGPCVRCLLAEAEEVSALGRRPLWEDPEEEYLDVVGPFALLAPIGHGGSGKVFRARHLETGRLVALKLLSAEVSLARVEREVSALAALHHPNVVGIVQRGEHGGRAYLAMDFIDGPNLAEATRSEISDLRFEISEAVRVMTLVARAVAHAHEHGLLHRDLKPHNILLDREGRPFVTDFGLARRQEEVSLTHTGAVVGTPAYMAPEQIDPARGPLTVRTDVYGLGATLYHLLTGAPPFRGESVQQTFHAVLNAEPVPPGRVRAGVDRDLEAICLGCLEKEPARRYTSALDVAEELERWSRGEPIRRRPIGPVTQFAKWCRRRPALAGLAGAAVLATLLGAAGVLWQWNQTRAANRRLAAEVSRARRELAEQQFRGGEVSAGLRVLAAHVRDQPGDADSAERLWSAIARRAWSLPEATFTVPDLVAAVRWHPEGRQLALITAQQATATNFDLSVVKIATGRTLAGPVPLAGTSGSVEYSPDGRRLFALFGGEARCFDAATLATPPAPCAAGLLVNDFSWHPDGRRVALARNNAVWLVELPAAASEISDLRFEISEHAARFAMPTNVTALALRPDGRALAAGDAAGHVRVWETDSARLLAELPRQASGIAAVLLAPGGERAVTRTTDRQVSLWELPGGREVARLPPGIVTAASGDGRWLVVHGDDRVWLCEAVAGKTIRQWNQAAVPAGFAPNDDALVLIEGNLALRWLTVPDLEPLGEPVRYTWQVEQPRFSPDGQFLAVPTSRGDVTVWRRPQAGLEPQRLLGRVGRFAVSRDGWIAAAEGAEVSVFDTSNRLIHRLAVRTNVTVLVFSPDGQWLVVGTQDGNATVFDARDGQAIAVCKGEGHAFWRMAFASDGSQLAAGSPDGWLHRWELPSGRPLTPPQDLLSAHPSPFGRRDINAVVFSADGRTLAAACGNGEVHVFPARATKAAFVLGHEGASALDAAFSYDGRRLAVACYDSFARIYAAAAGRPLTVKLPHDGAVISVNFSPDDTRLLTTSTDGRARLWDTASGRLLATTVGHSNYVFRAAFAPGGERFLTTATDQTVRVWDTATGLPLGEPLRHARLDAAFAHWRGEDAVALAAPGEPLLLYPAPRPPVPVPPWFPDLADLLSGLTTNQTTAQDLMRLGAERLADKEVGFWNTWARQFFAAQQRARPGHGE